MLRSRARREAGSAREIDLAGRLSTAPSVSGDRLESPLSAGDFPGWDKNVLPPHGRVIFCAERVPPYDEERRWLRSFADHLLGTAKSTRPLTRDEILDQLAIALADSRGEPSTQKGTR